MCVGLKKNSLLGFYGYFSVSFTFLPYSIHSIIKRKIGMNTIKRIISIITNTPRLYIYLNFDLPNLQINFELFSTLLFSIYPNRNYKFLYLLYISTPSSIFYDYLNKVKDPKLNKYLNNNKRICVGISL